MSKMMPAWLLIFGPKQTQNNSLWLPSLDIVSSRHYIYDLQTKLYVIWRWSAPMLSEMQEIKPHMTCMHYSEFKRGIKEQLDT